MKYEQQNALIKKIFYAKYWIKNRRITTLYYLTERWPSRAEYIQSYIDRLLIEY